MSFEEERIATLEQPEETAAPQTTEKTIEAGPQEPESLHDQLKHQAELLVLSIHQLIGQDSRRANNGLLRQHQELADVTDLALAGLLIEKGVFTHEEFLTASIKVLKSKIAENEKELGLS